MTTTTNAAPIQVEPSGYGTHLVVRADGLTVTRLHEETSEAKAETIAAFLNYLQIAHPVEPRIVHWLRENVTDRPSPEAVPLLEQARDLYSELVDRDVRSADDIASDYGLGLYGGNEMRATDADLGELVEALRARLNELERDYELGR